MQWKRKMGKKAERSPEMEGWTVSAVFVQESAGVSKTVIGGLQNEYGYF